MIRWAVALAVASAACSPRADLPGCLVDEPSELGNACAGDGECGNWLVCDGTCEVPPAVTGEGGSSARLRSNGEIMQLQVEIARSDIARDRGLGSRPCMADGWGLILAFPSAGERFITTRTMRFDLDIAMVGEDGVIHTIHRDAPAGGEALYGAELPVKDVLEIAAGSLPLALGAQLEYD